ncbi:MAG: hypothetical protein EBS07_11280 [Sphingobacteriia bacterium]|nr:hypothetical protein [Sphingobacteriia bacterium]
MTSIQNVNINWVVNSGNLNLFSQDTLTGRADFDISTGFSSSIIYVMGTGGYPYTSATNSFEVTSCNGDFCFFGGFGTLPRIWIANDINAPQSGCFSTIVLAGKDITFVGHNSVTLNPGFEVQLGATFSAF